MSKPLIVQSDMSVLLEVDHPDFEKIRSQIGRFSELEKSPEHIHTYRINSISIWNGAASGMKLEEIESFLDQYSKYDVPQNVVFRIRDTYKNYGRLVFVKDENGIILKSDGYLIIEEAKKHKKIAPFLTNQIDKFSVYINPNFRGYLKKEFIDIGYPIKDDAGYVEGKPFNFTLAETTKNGSPFYLRDYQVESVNKFYHGGDNSGGSGVIVLPCGAGKTVVGIGVMNKYQTETLILTTNIIALRQWRDELIEKTDIDPNLIGEYSGEKKEIKPITIATYNIMTYRKSKDAEFTHFKLFSENNWGFIIYDEVHLLPAPVFRVTAEIQTKKRLGLTATLIREDGLEKDVFSLIGPKKYDIPWKELENKCWIATAICHELRIEMDSDLRIEYLSSNEREKFRLSSTNPKKTVVIEELIKKHEGDSILIIGQYIKQLQGIAQKFNLPLITGSTPTSTRQKLYEGFRLGKLPILVVSKVANFAIDLPDANVAIQISGTFGSRQEEAQRLGRILRPKKGNNTSWFYTIITTGSKEQTFAANRQLFLTEQGYSYKIESKIT